MPPNHDTPEPLPSETGAASPVPPSPGQQLREAREHAGLTQQQVAQALHMTVHKVNAIENDEYNKLNTDTFIRGYLRSYANYLKLDSARLISAYEQQAIARGLLPAVADTLIRDPGASRSWSFILWLVGLLLLLLLISVWFFGNSINSVPAASVTRVSPAPPVAAERVEETPVEAGQSDEAVAGESAGDTAEPAAESPVAGDVAVIEEQSSVASLDRLVLRFSDECWLEVSDAQGDVLATDLQRPGSELVLEGRAPFQVKLGNARAVSGSLNNQPLSFENPADLRVLTVTVGD